MRFAAWSSGTRVTWHSSSAEMTSRCRLSSFSAANSGAWCCIPSAKRSSWSSRAPLGAYLRACAKSFIIRRTLCPRNVRCTIVAAFCIDAYSAGRSRWSHSSACAVAISATARDFDALSLSSPATPRSPEIFAAAPFPPPFPNPLALATTARAYRTTARRKTTRTTILRMFLLTLGNSATTPMRASRSRHRTTEWHRVIAGGHGSPRWSFGSRKSRSIPSSVPTGWIRPRVAMRPFSTMNRQSRLIGLAKTSSCGESTTELRCALRSPGSRRGASLNRGMFRTHPPNTSSATSSLSESLIMCITPDHSTIARDRLRNLKKSRSFIRKSLVTFFSFMNRFSSSIWRKNVLLDSSMLVMMLHTDPSRYAYTAPPTNVQHTEYSRSALVSGTTSPYPSVDSVATAQYTDATYNVASDT